MSWTPQNAVPTVSTSESTTVTVPEFCVFSCFGPTPVTVPLASVTPNSGTIAVIRYRGQDYPISTTSVPPIPAVGLTTPPPGFAGKGCSLFAVEDPTVPDHWLLITQGGPVVATDPTNEYEYIDYSCRITVNSNPEWGRSGYAPTVSDRVANFDEDVVGVCLFTEWIDDIGSYHEANSCADSTAVGTARVVV